MMKLIFSALVISMFVIAVGALSYFQVDEEALANGLTYIENPNRLWVLFPGQNISIKPYPGTQTSKICYAIYDNAWEEELSGDYLKGKCIDADSGLPGECDSQSDIFFGSRGSYMVNGAIGFKIGFNNYFDDLYLCSYDTKRARRLAGFVFGDELALDAVLPGRFPSLGLDPGNHTFKIQNGPNQTSLCIETNEGNFRKLRIFKNGSFSLKKEINPSGHYCTDRDKINVHMKGQPLGNKYISYWGSGPGGIKERPKKYSFFYTDRPYSVVFSRNFFSSIYPETKTSSLIGKEMTYYSDFYIISEYNEDINGIWVNVGGQWLFLEQKGDFITSRINHSFLRGRGPNKMSFFAQSEKNGTESEYAYYRVFEPRVSDFLLNITKTSQDNYSLSINISVKENAYSVLYFYLGGKFVRPLNVNGSSDSFDFVVRGGGDAKFVLEPVTFFGYMASNNTLNVSLPNLNPYSENFKITADMNNNMLRASGDYADPEGDKEGNSSYSWLFPNGSLVSVSSEIGLENIYHNITARYVPEDYRGRKGPAYTKRVFPSDILSGFERLKLVVRSKKLGCGVLENDSLMDMCSWLEEKDRELAGFAGKCWLFEKDMKYYCDEGIKESVFQNNCKTLGCVSDTIDSFDISVPMDRFMFILAINSSNESMCHQIENKTLRETCISGMKTADKDCSERSLNEKLFCLAFLKKNPVYCGLISLKWYSLSCMDIFPETEDLCIRVKGIDRDLCLLESATANDDIGTCDMISDHGLFSYCTAVLEKSPGLCRGIQDSALRERCETESLYK